MPWPPKDDTKFQAARRGVELSSRAPKMLDALRLIHFAMVTDYDSIRERDRKIMAVLLAALKGTEDL